MFMGEFDHTLDGKGRLTIPAKLRHEFSDGLVVTRGLDQCLFIYTVQGFDAYVATFDRLPPDKESARAFNRFVFSGANKLFPDKQGRILLPAVLREFAALDDDVVIIGANHRLEVWAADKWRVTLAEVEQDVTKFVEDLPTPML